MQKPIVFLSHSSSDKKQLIALKELLDKRAVGSLEFFLSSDGQSIRFGRNWVVRVSDALSQTKLMFVFLSPQSVDSKWIHFEAGCAYAKSIEVVPVCLPGLKLGKVTAPLNLLQGFNLHSPEAIGNIARLCNDTFNLRIEETFSPQDYDRVFAHSVAEQDGFFGRYARQVTSIEFILSSKDSAKKALNASKTFKSICADAGIEPIALVLDDKKSGAFECPGCFIDITLSDPENKGVSRVTGKLSPELFHLTAPLVDKWLSALGLTERVQAHIEFRLPEFCTSERHRLTTKLYKSGIRVISFNEFDCSGFRFRFRGLPSSVLEFEWSGKLDDDRLVKVVSTCLDLELFRNYPK